MRPSTTPFGPFHADDQSNESQGTNNGTKDTTTREKPVDPSKGRR
jgi:hypothetical protein